MSDLTPTGRQVLLLLHNLNPSGHYSPLIEQLEREAGQRAVEEYRNPPRSECPDCPHWREIHSPDGTCGCGASHPSLVTAG